MKTVMMIAMMLGLALSGHAQTEWTKLAGTWESNDGGGIEVVDSSHLFITYDGKKKPLKACQLNFKSRPNTFDFTVTDSSGDMPMQSLFMFVNDDLIQWQVFDAGKRPGNFDPAKGELIFLRRKKG